LHEFHAARSLVARLRVDPGLGVGGKVSAVHVRASPEFAPDSLRQAYEMLVAGTPLAGSQLVVEETARAHECAQCGSSWAVTRDHVAGHVLICPSCGAASGVGSSGGVELVEVVREGG